MFDDDEAAGEAPYARLQAEMQPKKKHDLKVLGCKTNMLSRTSSRQSLRSERQRVRIVTPREEMQQTQTNIQI